MAGIYSELKYTCPGCKKPMRGVSNDGKEFVFPRHNSNGDRCPSSRSPIDPKTASMSIESVASKGNEEVDHD